MRKRICVGLLLLFLALLLLGCQKELNLSDLSVYKDTEITISGLQETDFTITVEDLTALDMVSRKTSAKRANGETVSITAEGPLLDIFLAAYGYKQTDFTRIRFIASDNYSIALTQNVLQNREVILAVADGGSPLKEEDQPVRVVVPGERAMYWVRMLSKISFESGAEASSAVACRKIILLEAAANSLPMQDYEYYGAQDKTVRVTDLFGNYAGGVDAANVHLIAGDGLEKTESTSDMNLGLIKFTGEDSPRFISEQLPVGMHTFDIVWINFGEVRFLSMKHLLGQEDELFFSDLLQQGEVVSAETYYFTCADQSSLMLDLEELSEASISLDDIGNVSLSLGGGSEVISNILSIEAL